MRSCDRSMVKRELEKKFLTWKKLGKFLTKELRYIPLC